MPRPPLSFDPIDTARENWEAAGWEESAVGMAVVTSVMRVHQILLARADEVLSAVGLTFARYEALMLLHFSSRGSLPLGKIGSRLQVHPASVTNVVDRLEADGLAERRPHPNDRRTTLAVITPRGRAVALDATHLLNERVFADPTLVAEGHQILDSLRRVRRDAGDFV